MSDTIRMSLYIDMDTKRHLETITYLINKEFESSIDIDSISNRLHKVKPSEVIIDRAFINEAVYSE
jgi:hypothetical protein